MVNSGKCARLGNQYLIPVSISRIQHRTATTIIILLNARSRPLTLVGLGSKPSRSMELAGQEKHCFGCV